MENEHTKTKKKIKRTLNFTKNTVKYIPKPPCQSNDQTRKESPSDATFSTLIPTNRSSNHSFSATSLPRILCH